MRIADGFRWCIPFALALLLPAEALANSTCGPGAEEVSRTETSGEITLSCRCLKGYKREGNACKPRHPDPFQETEKERRDRISNRQSYPIMPAEVRGEVYLLKPDGSKVPIEAHRIMMIDTETRVVTGPGGRLQILLPDETVFTLGPNSDMVLDRFVFDPKTSLSSFTADITKGIFRWVSAKVARRSVTNSLNLTVGTIGIRGTEFDLVVSGDGSGQVKLHSGELLITPKSGAPAFILRAGLMLDFSSSGAVAAPRPIPE